MSRKTNVTVACDLKHATEVPATETVTFSVNGTMNEVDLCEADAAKWRKAVGPFEKASRPVRRRTGQQAPRPQWKRDRSRRIRDWADGLLKEEFPPAPPEFAGVSRLGRLPAELDQAAVAAGVVDPLPEDG